MLKNSTRLLTGFTAAVLLLAVFALPALASGNAGMKKSWNNSHHSFFGNRQFITMLSGASEAPGPGDPDGFGFAFVRLNKKQNQVCYHIRVQGIALPASAAHIHEGQKGEPGPVVVGLNPPDGSGRSSGCTTISHELLKQIRRNPENYYVNVHNAPYPNGAVRGQLAD